MPRIEHVSKAQFLNLDTGDAAVQSPAALIAIGEDLDNNVVSFAEDDPEDPINWSQWYKWLLVALVSTMSLLEYVSFVCSTYVKGQQTHQ